MKVNYWIWGLSLFFAVHGMAQDLRHYELAPVDSVNHSSVYRFNKLQDIVIPDRFFHKEKLTWDKYLYEKLFDESLIIADEPGFKLLGDPLLNLDAGQEQVSGEPIWGNTRGVQVRGLVTLKPKSSLSTMNKKNPAGESPTLTFYSAYFESQSKFSPYLDSIVRTYRVTPGELYYRSTGHGVDHSHAVGWLQYKPNDIFSFEAGHGKNFFGNGYRSLLLSDGAANYPYFRIDTRIWRIHYVNLWAEFQDVNYSNNFGDGYQKKYGAFHYLSFAVTKRFEVSLLEVVNWQGRDSTHVRGFDINYLNPVILLRPVEWTMGSPDNVIMGLNLSYKFGQSTYLYGQLVMDEAKISELKDWSNGWWANKLGWQGGIKTWIPLGGQSPARHVYLQTEFNAVRPYTYSYRNSKQNYGHMNQSLAHPLGANFYEWVNFARFRWDRFVAEARYSWAKFGSDYNGSNYGHNIYLPYVTYESEYGNFIGQGLENILTYKSLNLSYLINKASYFNIFMNLTDRHQITEYKDKHDLIIQFGVRNSIRNLYHDF